MTERKLSGTEVAQNLEVSGAAISDWCAGKKLPSLVNRLKIERYTTMHGGRGRVRRLGISPKASNWGAGERAEDSAGITDDRRQSIDRVVPYDLSQRATAG